MTTKRRHLLGALGGLAVLGAGRALATKSLLATPRQGEGPFYPPKLPRDKDFDLIHDEQAIRSAGAEILLLEGRVVATDGSPLKGAAVEIWQCDAHGIYLHPRAPRSDSHDRAFQGFGRVATDTGGRYKFRTIVPVPYVGRTPHIHVKVRYAARDVLTTQLYLADHPDNAGDFLFARLREGDRARLLMALAPAKTAAGPAWRSDVDLVVGGIA